MKKYNATAKSVMTNSLKKRSLKFFESLPLKLSEKASSFKNPSSKHATQNFLRVPLGTEAPQQKCSIITNSSCLMDVKDESFCCQNDRILKKEKKSCIPSSGGNWKWKPTWPPVWKSWRTTFLLAHSACSFLLNPSCFPASTPFVSAASNNISHTITSLSRSACARFARNRPPFQMETRPNSKTIFWS